MKLTPQQECLYCKHRGEIDFKNMTYCVKVSNIVEATQNAKYLGYWEYHDRYAYQFKTTKCPNWEKR